MTPTPTMTWQAFDCPRIEALGARAGLASLLLSLTQAVAARPEVDVLLAGLSELFEDLSGQAAACAGVVILTDAEEFQNEVFRFVPQSPAGGCTNERDPLAACASAGLDLVAELREREACFLMGAGTSQATAFFGVRGASGLLAVFYIKLPGAELANFGQASAAAATLFSPLAGLVLAQRRRQALAHGVLEENRYFAERERRHYLFKELVCESATMRAVYDALNERVARDTPVLITGEAGTGKELLARALHHLSWRKEGMLISLDCSQLTNDLLDFELFGCVASELAGAVAARKGIFELARNGTVFLDEIDLLSPLMQGKIVRMLKEGEVRRIGDAVGRSVNARLIASTHRDLQTLVNEGKLRHDLFLALRGHVLEVPALRHRQADILPLARTFLRSYCQRYGARCRKFDDATLAWMLAYRWPGNVRQLQSFIESAVLRAPEEEVVSMDGWQVEAT
ncbi:MAG: sigma-54-dependent Fis family transcriptional regulator [Bradymonadaceae bacterium]|nr:sigma-54-dependent Fis family transcriptional regulator [Lujinxingiaceae bacterium]